MIMSIFRILSLDGGGVRGAYSAAALAEIERRQIPPQSNVKLIDYFDLITGTSTGGILAIGLGLGFSAKDLLEFYQDNAQYIFPSTGLLSGIRARARQLYTTKYKEKNLRTVLKKQFECRQLGESHRPLVIVSYNASHNGPHLFKTAHHIDHTRHYRQSAVDIAMATGAAPLYFRSVELPLGDNNKMQTFVDGGVWANCPVLVGVAEATKYLGVPLDNIHVLSIGTTFGTFQIRDSQMSGGIAQWRLRLFDLIMSAQQAGVIGTANVLLKTPVARITREVKKEVALDNPKEVPNLVRWGKEDAGNKFNEIQQQFLTTTVPTFQPKHPI